MTYVRIAHRGNTTGNREMDNNQSAIVESLGKGYDAEIDVWLIGNYWCLGHDAPEYVVPEKFLINDNLWIHCKEQRSFFVLSRTGLNCFMHDDTSYRNGVVAVTTKGFIWKYPEVYTLCGKLYGICEDNLR